MHARIHFGPIYHVIFHTYVHGQHVCSLNENTIYSLCHEETQQSFFFFENQSHSKNCNKDRKRNEEKRAKRCALKTGGIKPKVIYRFDKITNDFIAVQHLIFTVKFKTIITTWAKE